MGVGASRAHRIEHLVQQYVTMSYSNVCAETLAAERPSRSISDVFDKVRVSPFPPSSKGPCRRRSVRPARRGHSHAYLQACKDVLLPTSSVLRCQILN